MVGPSGRAGKLSLWKMVNLSKGRKGKHSSFHTVSLLLREIITVQLSSEKHVGFCEEFFRFSNRDGKPQGAHSRRGDTSTPRPAQGEGAAPRCQRGGQPVPGGGHQLRLPGDRGCPLPVGGGGCKASREPKPALNPQSASPGCPMEGRPPRDCGGKLGHPWRPGCHRRWDTLGTALTGPAGLGLLRRPPGTQARGSPGSGRAGARAGSCRDRSPGRSCQWQTVQCFWFGAG